MDHHVQVQVQLLRRQYLQLVDPSALSFPSTLHTLDFQSAFYNALFASTAVQTPSPPERYTARVLKQLISLLSYPPPEEEEEEAETPSSPEAASTNHEVHEGLLKLYTNLLSRSSAATPLDTARSYVTYVLPPSPFSHREIGPPITLRESRCVISRHGTTGLRTWEAAMALAEYLICAHLARIYKNVPFAEAVEGCGTVLRESDRVLELGAGTGLVSIVAARLGAAKVLATDGDWKVCEELLENVVISGVNDVVTVRKRLWGEVDSDEKFDLVLGGDVTYDAAAIPLLVKELDRLVYRNPNVKIIISATIRNENTFAVFEDVCRKNNFTLQQEYWTPPTPSMFFYTAIAPIRIIRVSRLVPN